MFILDSNALFGSLHVAYNKNRAGVAVSDVLPTPNISNMTDLLSHIHQGGSPTVRFRLRYLGFRRIILIFVNRWVMIKDKNKCWILLGQFYEICQKCLSWLKLLTLVCSCNIFLCYVLRWYLLRNPEFCGQFISDWFLTLLPLRNSAIVLVF